MLRLLWLWLLRLLLLRRDCLLRCWGHPARGETRHLEDAWRRGRAPVGRLAVPPALLPLLRRLLVALRRRRHTPRLAVCLLLRLLGLTLLRLRVLLRPWQRRLDWRPLLLLRPLLHRLCAALLLVLWWLLLLLLCRPGLHCSWLCKRRLRLGLRLRPRRCLQVREAACYAPHSFYLDVQCG
jgi:hypothetical protein